MNNDILPSEQQHNISINNIYDVTSFDLYKDGEA